MNMNRKHHSLNLIIQKGNKEKNRKKKTTTDLVDEEVKTVLSMMLGYLIMENIYRQQRIDPLIALFEKFSKLTMY